MDVIKFHVDHLKQLRLQRAQADCATTITDDLLAAHETLEAYTVIERGQYIAVAGLMHLWEGRAMGWSYLSEGAGAHLRALTRSVKNFLDGQEVRRIECYVDPQFEAGLRWASLLGFEFEGILRAYTPQGRDAAIFARVRHDGPG